MADVKKVINWIECCLRRDELNCIENCPYYTVEGYNAHRCWIPLNRDALELLKAQTPIEPIRDSFLNWHCGNCRREIDKYEGDVYCPGCGRKVKWE